jgi:hypothetical protein
MKGTRMFYAKREDTAVTPRMLPMSYYNEAISEKKTDLVSYIDGKGGFSKRLKADSLSYVEEERTSVTNSVFFNVRSFHSIARESESPLVEKINLTNGGQIEIKIDAGQMDIYSRKYGKNEPSHQVSKKLAAGLSPYQALANAENSIKHRLSLIEQMKRGRETQNGLVSYEKRQEDLRKRKWNQLFEEIGEGIDPEIVAAIHEMERERDAA